VRHTAAHLVGKIGDPSAVGAVVALTADADDDVAAKARFVLSRLGDPSAIPALTAYLGRGGEDRRTELTRDLASFGSAAVSHLRPLLQHGDPAVRDHARWVLEVIAETRDAADDRTDLTLTRREPPGSGV
jgi:HEAT repeat protein